MLKISSLVMSATIAAALFIGSTGSALATSYVKGNGRITSSCPGNVVKTGSFSSGQGKWFLYYSSIDNGTNCLIVKDYVSGSNFMRARIASTDNINIADDYGTYSTYAGASRIRGTKGKCVKIIATWKTYSYTNNAIACG